MPSDPRLAPGAKFLRRRSAAGTCGRSEDSNGREGCGAFSFDIWSVDETIAYDVDSIVPTGLNGSSKTGLKPRTAVLGYVQSRLRRLAQQRWAEPRVDRKSTCVLAWRPSAAGPYGLPHKSKTLSGRIDVLTADHVGEWRFPPSANRVRRRHARH
jgi:hypothetical protein